VGYVEDFDELRTTLEGFFSILLRRFRCDSIGSEGGGIDLLQPKIGMPDELPLEPLTGCSLVPQLNTDFVQIPLDLLHPPLAQPRDPIAFAHGTHVLRQCLENCGIALSPMVLHQRKSLGASTLYDRIQRRRLHPEKVEYAREEQCQGRKAKKLHHRGRDRRRMA